MTCSHFVMHTSMLTVGLSSLCFKQLCAFRTMVELERAMKENSNCRSPILKGTFSPEEVSNVPFK